MNLKKILLLFFILFTIESIALYSVKKYSLLNLNPKELLRNTRNFFSNNLLFLSMICYSLIPIILFYLLKESLDIGYINLVWNVMSNIYGLLIGIFLFSELIRGIQWIGISFAMFGLLLIYIGEKNK